MITLIISCLCCLIPLILCYWRYKWILEDQKLGLTGPPLTLFFGNAWEILKHTSKKKGFLKFLEYSREYNGTFRLRLCNRLLIFSSDIRIFEAVVNNPKFDKGEEYKFYEPWLGQSTLTSSGARWFKLRKLITPAFHFQILEDFITIFEKHANILTEKYKNNGNTIVDVVPNNSLCTLDVMAETSMGTCLHAQTSPTNYTVAVQEILRILDTRILHPLYKYDWIWKLTNLYKQQIKCLTDINKLVETIIEQRHNELLKQRKEPFEPKRPTLVDILLQSRIDGQSLTNDDIKGEINTFLFAGHETTSNALSNIMFTLAKHSNVQDKLFQEIKDNIIDAGIIKLNIRIINSLSYLDAVIKETLRLYPIVPMITKQSCTDTKIEDITIPANTSLVLLFHACHTNEKYFANPLKFDPDRFTNTTQVNVHSPYIYQPFSSGPRNCIGQRFAMLELKTVLIKILSELIIEVNDDFTPDFCCDTLLKSRNGIQLKFKKRNY